MIRPAPIATIAAALLAACGPAAPASPDPLAAASPRPEPPRFDPAAVERARAQLLALPEVGDILFDPLPLSVEWQVGVAAGTPAGLDLARQYCRHLEAAGLVDEDTDLRVVDLGRLDTAPGDFRAAGIGHADCVTGDNLGV